MQKVSTQQGFTLIELIIVIVLLGILAVTAAPKFLNLQDDARDSVLEGIAGSLESASSVVYGKALINDVAGTCDGSDDVNIGTGTVSVVFGYPDAATAANFTNILDADINTVDDENSDRSPPFVTCVDKPDPSNASDNLCSGALGPDAGETSEEAYDDVDDYNGYAISNVGGNYNGFAYRVDVAYESSIDVTSDPGSVVHCPDPEEKINPCAVPENKQYKRIDIAVTAPDGQVYNFSAYRGSY